MCLIVFAYRQHPAWRLIVAANRDEFYARPTAPLGFWDDAPDILAGRDVSAGGTWLGVDHSGRFSAITNFRDSRGVLQDAPSRGLLVSNYLRSGASAHTYLETIRARARHYNGFSLLVGDDDGLYYYCNREDAARELRPGFYGLSNHLLDTPWPKVLRAKCRLQRLVDADELEPRALLAILSDRTRPADEELPDTGAGLQWERIFSPIFITSETYGTRSSTALLLGHDGRASVTERQGAGGDLRSYSIEPR
jgi:uncharacterized protein with NRDE domain